VSYLLRRGNLEGCSSCPGNPSPEVCATLTVTPPPPVVPVVVLDALRLEPPTLAVGEYVRIILTFRETAGVSGTVYYRVTWQETAPEVGPVTTLVERSRSIGAYETVEEVVTWGPMEDWMADRQFSVCGEVTGTA